MSEGSVGAWGSGRYADPRNPYNRDAWDTDGDGIVEANPIERRQRFYFPPPSMLDPNAGPYQTAESVAGALAKQSDFQEYAERVDGQSRAITDLQNVSAASRPAPAWLSPDVQDMASFPYWLMQPYPKLERVPSGDTRFDEIVTARTSLAGGHSHTYQGNYSGTGNTSYQMDHDHVLTMANPAYVPANKSIELSLIVADRTAYLEQLKFCSGRDELVYPVRSMLAALYALNPQNGRIEKFWGSGELKGEYVESATMYSVPLLKDDGKRQQSSPGQLVFAALWQDATGFGSGPRSLGCAYSPMYTVVTKGWLKSGAFTLPGQPGLPDWIDFTDLRPNYRRQFWCAITTS